MIWIEKIGSSLLGLIYPNLCDVCSKPLVVGERVICLTCLYRMPKTNFWDQADNAVEQLFWGKQHVEHACALFFFRKGSAFRPLLHKLKYQGRKDIGVRLGEELGRRLLGSLLYSGIDCIVPVPLHPIRERKRGYNQSEQLAKGLSQAMKVPVCSHNLVRSAYTDSQTSKGRMERWDNVSTVFTVHQPEQLNNKHILLVDDVITTGSTLEACIDSLQKNTSCKVSVAALGFASVG